MSADLDILNEVGNQLSDPASYRQVNGHIWAAYYGVKPPALQKMSFILFHFIIGNKFYGDKAEVCKKEIDESKRIYNDISVTMKDILLEWDHSKYSNDKAAAMVKSNMNQNIRALDEAQIFYCWKYEDLYMFVMERDFRTWKCYNSQGCLIPKTLKKIVVVGQDMLFCMEKNVKKMYNAVNKTAIESSFGNFLNRLINKLNPLVASEIVKWDGNMDVGEYLVQLSENLKGIAPFQGLTLADDMLQKFPRSISIKHDKKVNEAIAMKKTELAKDKVVCVDSEKDIIPDNPNIAKPRRQKIITHNLVITKDKIDKYVFDANVDPLRDAKHFMEYYRASLQQHFHHTRIKFDGHGSDALYATQILDLLIENKRSDQAFLNGWIRYFYEYRLKGNKNNKAKYTSLKAFKDTFDEFNPRYVG